MTGERAVAAVQRVIKRVQASAQLSVFVGHEHAIDFHVDAGDVVDGRAFDVQDPCHLQTVARPGDGCVRRR